MQRFDPRFWRNFTPGAFGVRVAVPMGIIVGGKSALFPEGRLEELQKMLPDCRFTTVIEDAHHHVLVDTPLELVAAIRGAAAGRPQMHPAKPPTKARP